MLINNLTDQKFERLTVIKDSKRRTKSGNVIWECKCDCGTITQVRGNDLISHNTKSCGCLDHEPKRKVIHGHKRGTQSPTYTSWMHMKYRCFNPNSRDFKYYGAKGIKVCERWVNSFENFLKDMGERPGVEYSISRKNHDGNYEPSNCEWALKGSH